MLSRYFFVSFIFLLGIASSKPTPLEALDQISAKKSFSLKQIAAERAAPWSAAHSIRDTYLKYGAEPPGYIKENIIMTEARMRTVLAGKAEPNNKGSGPIRPGSNDADFLVNVQVGNYNLSLSLDTASSDLWVWSTLMPEKMRNRPSRRIYDTNSPTAQKLQGHSFNITYQDKTSVSGQVFYEKVTLGSLSVPRQAVEAASSVSRNLIGDGGGDGILGLAFNKLNRVKPTRQLTWFDNIRSKLATPVFAVSLKRRAPGTYDFGYIDKTKYRGGIVWTDVKGVKGYWDFTPSGWAIGEGKQMNFTRPINAIVDTGSSLWYVPKDVADNYWKAVSGAKSTHFYTFPCTSKLPDMHVFIEGRKITVPGINMNYQAGGNGYCLGGIQSDSGLPFSIFGGCFLKNLYVIHDAASSGKLRLGFAAAAGTPK